MLIVCSSSSLRSRRQHRAWGVSPRKTFVDLREPVKRAAEHISMNDDQRLSPALRACLFHALLPGVAALRALPQALCLRPRPRAKKCAEALPEHPVLTLSGYLIKHFYVIKAPSFRIHLLICLQKMSEDTQAKLVAPQIYWQIVESVGEIRRLLGFAF